MCVFVAISSNAKICVHNNHLFGVDLLQRMNKDEDNKVPESILLTYGRIVGWLVLRNKRNPNGDYIGHRVRSFNSPLTENNERLPFGINLNILFLNNGRCLASAIIIILHALECLGKNLIGPN